MLKKLLRRELNNFFDFLKVAGIVIGGLAFAGVIGIGNVFLLAATLISLIEENIIIAISTGLAELGLFYLTVRLVEKLI